MGLAAIVSVVHPGASNEGKKSAFTRRYQGLEQFEYPQRNSIFRTRSL